MHADAFAQAWVTGPDAIEAQLSDRVELVCTRSDALSKVAECRIEPPERVDQAVLMGIAPAPDPAPGEWFDFFEALTSTRGDGIEKTSVDVIHLALEMRFLFVLQEASWVLHVRACPSLYDLDGDPEFSKQRRTGQPWR